MKLETMLNAMLKADKVISKKRCRQYDTFRDRILRMDAEKDKQIMSLIGKNARMTARIKELEAALQKIANAADIFHVPYYGKYFRELQEIARKELSE